MLIKTTLKSIAIGLVISVSLIHPAFATTSPGALFNITGSGPLGSVNLSLCLNGNGPLSCQNYMVSNLDLSISTTVPNHTYPAAGIKITSPGYTFADCTPLANGYCLFSVSNSSAASIVLAETGTPYTIGGNISGLSGSLVLENNGADPYSTSLSGAFTFANPQAAGSVYAVTVSSQPATQTCSVTSGSGNVSNTNIDNVTVTCAVNAYTVGGEVSNLSGTLVLENNGSDSKTITTNGEYAFTTPVAEGSGYDVTVVTQPAGQTCIVNNPTGTMGGGNVTNVSVNCLNTTTLTASPSSLALSVNDPTDNAALTGNPRQITLTNTGSNAAVNVTYTVSGLPAGAVITPTSCGTIAARGGTCILTITPGSTASATPGNVDPTPITLSVSGTNTNTVTPEANILTYGSVYEGGYLFSVDDAYAGYPESKSIGGTVASLNDNSPGSMNWSPDFISIWGIAETSTIVDPIPNTSSATKYTDQANCDGNSNGTCDENNIYVYYQYNAQGHPISLSSYAAGICKATINGYSDWYLPSICQMGYDTTSSGSTCGTSVSPLMQNMQSNLVDNGAVGVGAPSGSTWSSTEASGNPQISAWFQDFASGSSVQSSQFKSDLAVVRCVRALTQSMSSR